MMKSVLFWLGLLAAFGMAGCDCGKKNPLPECDCSPTITFLSPTGTELTEFSDQNPDVDGIQVHVRVSTHCIAADGTSILLTNSLSSGSSVTAEVVADAEGSQVGTADFGEMTFLEGSNDICANVSALAVPWMESGDQECSARTKDGPDPVSASTCKTVVVQLGIPACRFEAPVDGSTLVAGDDSSAEDGFQHDATLVCTGVNDGETMSLSINQGAALEGQIANATITFEDVNLAQGANLLQAQTVGTDGSDVLAEIGVTVDTGECALRLLPQDGTTFSLADDEDPNTSGLQVTLTAETDAAGAFACDDGCDVIVHVGADSYSATLTNGQAQVVVTLPDGALQAWAEVSNCGSTGRSPINNYFVCATPVTIDISSPSEGLYITDAADQDLNTTGIQIDLSGTTAGVGDAESCWLLMDGNVVMDGGGMDPLHPSVFFPGSDYTFEDISFLESRAYTLQVRCVDACGQESASQVVNVTVQTDQLSCQITDPAPGALLAADDKNADPADGVQYDVTITCTNVPDGHGFDLQIGGQATLTGLSVTGGGWVGEVSFVEGDSKAMQVVLVTGETSPTVVVCVDGTPPTVNIGSPTSGASFGVADITVTGSTTGVPDGQLVTITVDDDFGQSAQFTATVNGNAYSVDVTLFDDSNLLTANVSDGACSGPGNPAEPMSVSVDGDFCVVAPTIDFLDPDGTQPQPISIPGTGAFTVRADVQGVLDSGSIRMFMLVNGFPTQPRGPDRWTPTIAEWDVTLTNGNTRFTVDASNACGDTRAFVDTFVGAVDAPTIGLSEPADGACSGDADVHVSATTTNVVPETPNAQCYCCVRSFEVNPVPECDQFSAALLALVDGAGVCQGDITLPFEDDWQIWCSVTNINFDTATSFPVGMELDQTAPVVAFASPTDAQQFSFGSVDAAPAAGFQILVSVTHDHGVLDTATLTGHGGIVSGPTFTDGQINWVVTVGEGDHTLNASATDCGGVTGQATPITITVDRVVPDVTIVDPLDLAEYGANSDESANPGFQYDVICSFVDAKVGDTVCLTRTVDGGPAAVDFVCHTLVAGQTNSYTFLAATLDPDGTDAASVVLDATITDPVGNQGADSVAISYNPTAPIVTITRPTNGETLNMFDDFCPAPGLQTQVDIQTANTELGDLLALCVCNGPCPAPNPGAQPDEPCERDGYGTTIWIDVVTGVTTPIPCADLQEGTNTLRGYSENLPGQGNYSNPVTVFVDSLPPTVDTLVVSSDGNGDGCLNQAEGGLQVDITLSDPNGNSLDGQTIRLYRDWPGGSVVATSTISGTSATFSASLANDTYDLTVVFNDVALNPNIRSANPIILDPEAQTLIEVDTQAPTLAITSPDHANLNAADDDNPGTPSVLDFTFAVSTNAENGQQVTFDPMAQTGAVSAGVASIATTLGQGGATLEAQVSDSCGNAATPATLIVTVDTILPTITCSQPTGGSVHNDQNVPFTCDTTGTDASRNIVVVSTIGGQRCTRPVDGSGTNVFTCSLLEGVQDLTVTVSDPAGNVSAPFAINNVDVDITGCSIGLTSHSGAEIFNAADDKDGNPANGLQIDVTACSGGCDFANCPACLVTLTLDGTPFGASLPLDAGGCVTFVDVNFADGETGTTVDVEIDDGAANLTNDAFTVELVDLLPPTIVLLAPGGVDVDCVAASGNPYVDGSLVLADTVAGGDCQMNFQVQVTDGGDAIYPGTVVLNKAGSPIAGPTPVATTPVTANWPNVTLAHDAIHNDLVALATDGAGNTASIALTVEADVIAPAEVGGVSGALAHTRHADVDMSWTAVGDDDNTGSVTAYEVRWASTEIDSDAAWDAAATIYSNTSISPTLQWLPPLNTYHFVVRAVDEVGNYGPRPAGDVEVANLWSSNLHTGSGVGFGFRLTALGNIDNDANNRDELASPNYLYSSNQGIVHVFYGTADLSTWSGAGADQELTRGATGEQFGFDVCGRGDIDGDTIPDLVVGGPGFESGRGRVSIYFGRDGAQLPASPDVEIRPAPATTGQLGRSVEIVGDINNDGFDDLFVGARYADGRGRGYILFGRDRAGVDSWTDTSNYANGNDGDGIDYVPTSNADLAFLGVDVDDLFSYHNGNVGLGDVDGDGFDDLALVASTVNEVYTFDGAEVSAITGRDINPATDSLDVITYNVPAGNDGFGVAGFGGADFTGDGRPDLIVSDINVDRVYLLASVATGGDPTHRIDTTFTSFVFNPANFGYSLDVMDINLDGWPDLLVGTNGASGNTAYLYYNSQSDPFVGPDPGSILTGTGFFGLGVALGDFDGNGLPDVVVASPIDGTLTVLH